MEFSIHLCFVSTEECERLHPKKSQQLHNLSNLKNLALGLKENKAEELPLILMSFIYAINIPISFGDECEYYNFKTGLPLVWFLNYLISVADKRPFNCIRNVCLLILLHFQSQGMHINISNKMAVTEQSQW